MHPPGSTTMTDQLSAWLDGRKAWFFIGLIGAYVALHFLLRVVFSPVIGTDDVTQAIYAQVLAWGYEFRQPPLYTWLQWGSDRLIGVGVASHAFLKYLLLFLTYLFLYLVARQVHARQSTAIIAAASLGLTYPFAVSIHQGVTHSILLTALIAASVWAFIRLERRPSLPGYLGLGLLLGLGVFSKYGFLVFAGAFLLAALSLPRYRRVLLDRRMLLALAIVILIALPPLLWLIERQTDTLAAAAALGPKTAQASTLPPRLANLASLLSSIVQFLAPLWLFLLIFFPKALRRTEAQPGMNEDAARLLGRTLAISLALLVLAMLAGLLGKVQPRWMHAFLLLFPLYFFARAEKAYAQGVARRGYVITLAAIPVLVIVLWAGQTYLGPSLGKATRFHAPYDQLARHLQEGNPEPGLIVAGDEYLAGNLRLYFPQAAVIAASFPFSPPAPAQGGCLLVWNTAAGASLPPPLEKFLVQAPGASAAGMKVWKGLYRHSSRDFLEAAYLALPREACRTSPE